MFLGISQTWRDIEHLSEVLIGMVLVGVGNASFSRRNFKIVVMVMAIVRYFDRVAWHAQSR
jgi:hypothetical protein